METAMVADNLSPFFLSGARRGGVFVTSSGRCRNGLAKRRRQFDRNSKGETDLTLVLTVGDDVAGYREAESRHTQLASRSGGPPAGDRDARSSFRYVHQPSRVTHAVENQLA